MGLFDKLHSGGEPSFNKQEAFAAIMLGVVAADGNISDEEMQDMVARITRMRLFAEASSAQLTAIIERIFGVLRKAGAEELTRRAAPILSSELRETAFAVAVDMVFADGAVQRASKHRSRDFKESWASQINLLAKLST